MYNFLLKNGQKLAIGLGVLVIAIFLINVFSGLSSAGYDTSTDLMKLPDEDRAAISFFNPGIYLTAMLAVIAAFLAFVVFGVMDLIKFPKSAIKFLGGLIVLLIIFFIIYSMSNPETTGKLAELHKEFEITDSISKLISAGLWTTLGLAGLAIVAMVFAELRNAFK